MFHAGTLWQIGQAVSTDLISSQHPEHVDIILWCVMYRVYGVTKIRLCNYGKFIRTWFFNITQKTMYSILLSYTNLVHDRFLLQALQ